MAGKQAPTEPAAIWVATADLKPWAANPRDNKAAIASVIKSVKRFGFGAPIVRNSRTGEVIAGHTRIAAALKIGMTPVPVRDLDLSPAEAHALALADNKLGEIATWDDAALADVLREIQEADASLLADTGFSDAEIAALLGENLPVVPEPDGTTPAIDESKPAVSQFGEMFELGPHRLVCGDSTDVETVKRLMGGDLAQMVFTDPPYGINLLNDGQSLGKSAKYLGVANDHDNKTAIAAFSLATKIFECPMFFWGANHYSSALPDSSCWVVWDKQAGKHVTFADVELCWTNLDCPARMITHVWDGFRRDSERGDRREHPTQKPIALVVEIWDLFDKMVGQSKIVVDLFGGSGSTLIACAQTGRVARLIEIDPRYCDVIRRRWTRWAKANGREAGSGGLDG